MWQAVIAGAIDDILRPETTGASFEEQCAAVQWVFDDGTGLASFNWACQQVGVEAQAVRRRLYENGLVYGG